MPERFVHAAQHAPPPPVVVHDLPERVKNVGALEVHVVRASLVYSITPDHGAVIPDASTASHDVLGSGGFTLRAFHVQALRIVGEPFVYPQVGDIRGRDAVAEPLVCALVDDDVIP